MFWRDSVGGRKTQNLAPTEMSPSPVLSVSPPVRWLSRSASMMGALKLRLNHRTGGLTESTGLGDISVGARFWVFRPPTESRQNIQVGFSVKLPTGKPDVTSRITGVPNPTTAVTTVDQSIQLGDSGTGDAVDFLAYKSLPARLTLFSTG